MNEEERWIFVFNLDEQLLKGGVILSEWCSFIVPEADNAFVSGANLASIITAMAGIETYLRSQYAEDRRLNLYDLIEQSPIVESLKCDIHALSASIEINGSTCLILKMIKRFLITPRKMSMNLSKKRGMLSEFCDRRSTRIHGFERPGSSGCLACFPTIAFTPASAMYGRVGD